MFEIKKEGTCFKIDNYPWDESGYKPETTVIISYDDGGYAVKFITNETNLRAVQTSHNTDIYRDSCMEIYMQFAPETDNHYMNIEINPNGVAYCSVALCREDYVKAESDDIDKLNIKTAVYDDRWEIEYYIPVWFIQKYIPTYQHKAGALLRGNFYKCGDDTDHPHFGCFSNIKWEYPDFHRPEFFAEFILS